MPHSHTLTATISMAWTISRPPGLRVCGSMSGRQQDHTQTAATVAAYQCNSAIEPAEKHWHDSTTFTYNTNCHPWTCSRELVDTCALSMHRSRYLFITNFGYRLICESI